MKTYSQKASEIKREWWLIDASSLPLGKLAVVIADKLMGKSKITYTPHIDNGDYVVVVNAKNIQVTGDKMTKKMYSRACCRVRSDIRRDFPISPAEARPDEVPFRHGIRWKDRL